MHVLHSLPGRFLMSGKNELAKKVIFCELQAGDGYFKKKNCMVGILKKTRSKVAKRSFRSALFMFFWPTNFSKQVIKSEILLSEKTLYIQRLVK